MKQHNEWSKTGASDAFHGEDAIDLTTPLMYVPEGESKVFILQGTPRQDDMPDVSRSPDGKLWVVPALLPAENISGLLILSTVAVHAIDRLVAECKERGLQVSGQAVEITNLGPRAGKAYNDIRVRWVPQQA